MKRKNKILVVDDSKLNRKSFADILEGDYAILEAENGKIALDILEKERESIALVILDLVMPVMDGFTFLEKYREIDAYKYIPVIVATTNDDVKIESRCLQLGVWDFIPKTFHKDIIRFRVLGAIDKSKVRVLEIDSLTGIYNQQKFFQTTREMLDNSGDEKYVFIHLDVERFRMIHSFYGTKEANRLLCSIAEAMTEVLEEYRNCTYGRINGDVFGICMPYEDVKDAKRVAEQISKKVKEHVVNYYLELSAGIYLIEDKDMDVSVIFDNASLAAGQCKGKYMVHEALYTKELGNNILWEQGIINEMDAALENEQFVVYFQPKYDLQSYHPYGAEALVRWQKPDGTMISPGEFIPIFEKNGFIIKLDYYVWDRVCRFLSAELKAGRDPEPISVNVSRVNLYNPQFLESLVDLVEKYKIPPKYLHLELTESAFCDETSLIRNSVEYLHRAGFTILMDDFGSGYSSLNVLKDIKLDVLKIDMKFLSKEKNERGTKILEAMIHMAKSLNMPVITEGVEQKEQVVLLKDLGCDYIQGYYFAKPMPLVKYRELIQVGGE